MKKSEFLKMVKEELDTIKAKATPEEIGRLNFEGFSATSRYTCVYGQMTGYCDSDRAKEISPKIFDAEYGDYGVFNNKKLEEGGLFTPLEEYLFFTGNENGDKSEKHSNIIKYLKGEISTISL